jgi:hypothetical protein
MTNIALLPKVIGDYKEKSYDEVKAIAENAGLHVKTAMGEDELVDSLVAIVAYKSLFKPVPAGYIYNRTTKKYYSLPGKVTITIEKANQNLFYHDGEFDTVESKEKVKVYIISAQPAGGKQKFFLVPFSKVKKYHKAIASLASGGGSVAAEVGEAIMNKVSTAFNMDTLCVSLMEDAPQEVVDEKTKKALKLKVVATEAQKEEMEMKKTETILYQRNLNAFLIVDMTDPMVQKAITTFIKLGGQIGFVKCSKDNPCEIGEYCALENDHIGKCIPEEAFDTKTNSDLFGGEQLVTVPVGDAIFRGKPEVMEEFKKLIGAGSASSAPAAERPVSPDEASVAGSVANREMEEEPDNLDEMRKAIRTCLQGDAISD